VTSSLNTIQRTFESSYKIVFTYHFSLLAPLPNIDPSLLIR